MFPEGQKRQVTRRVRHFGYPPAADMQWRSSADAEAAEPDADLPHPDGMRPEPANLQREAAWRRAAGVAREAAREIGCPRRPARGCGTRALAESS
jgi:hypothetical protein